jgi:threonine/homoserine/homoserine lactone efflux protein
MAIGTLWIIFSFSFVVALSGAMAPGPLLTYTIIKTMQTRKRGFLIGLFVIGGHALLESLLVIALLLGLSPFLKSPVAIRIIGSVGGVFLVALGCSLILDVVRKRVPDIFGEEGESGGSVKKPPRTISSPVLGGIIISMSNPYWWVWWASIGFAFMLRYKISFSNWPGLLAFLLGHEAGDLIWYAAVSTLVYLGRRHINRAIYGVVLCFCALVMIAFGLYLGISSFTGH